MDWIRFDNEENEETTTELTKTVVQHTLPVNPVKDDGIAKVLKPAEIETVLKKARKIVLEQIKIKDEKRTALKPFEVANVLRKVINVVVADGILAHYNAVTGYYERDDLYLRRLIGILEPALVRAAADEVLYRLKTFNFAHFNEELNIHSNFKIEYTDKKRYVVLSNGIFDKHEQVLLPHDPTCVKFTGVNTSYRVFKTSPTIDGWNVDDWLSELVDGDAELVQLLWQVIAASLTNYSHRQSIWLVGNGNDGKGTFQQLIINLIGFSNVAMLKLNQFSERFAVGQLENKLVCIGDDVAAGVYVDDSSTFNSVVTGEPIFIENKGKDGYSKKLDLTVIQSTNGLPRLKNKTKGSTRRFLIIPFRKSFDAETDNWKIKDEYIYQPEVLEYVLFRALSLDFDRFITPRASIEALEEFKSDNNPVVQFFNDLVESSALPNLLPMEYLWFKFKEWCSDTNVKNELNRKEFGTWLKTNPPVGWSYGKHRVPKSDTTVILAPYAGKSLQCLKSE